MAKLIEKEITTEDLTEYLKTTDDFAFEVDVFKLCHEYDSSAQHGGTYTDPITKVDRQFDIRMQIRSGKCTIKMAVECKNLKSFYPLLVSRLPRRREESYHEALAHISSDFKKFIYDKGSSIYKKLEPVGKSTTQVGRRTPESAKNSASPFQSSDEEVYGKWTQAIASAHDLVMAALPTFAPLSAGRDGEGIVVLPILVIPDQMLWVVDYEETGIQKGTPKQVDNCTYFLGKNIHLQGLPFTMNYRVSHLHFFTKTGLKQFLNEVCGEDYWEEILPRFPDKPQ